jgi:hypothetical protein
MVTETDGGASMLIPNNNIMSIEQIILIPKTWREIRKTFYGNDASGAYTGSKQSYGWNKR